MLDLINKLSGLIEKTFRGLGIISQCMSLAIGIAISLLVDRKIGAFWDTASDSEIVGERNSGCCQFRI
ncbi:MAG: hypothetical protein WDZ52_14890 [Pseudohongiellaceae bacterium]